MTATTALTAQNTLGVQDVHHTPPAFLRKQIDAVFEDVGVDCVKTGAFNLLHDIRTKTEITQACWHPRNRLKS